MQSDVQSSSELSCNRCGHALVYDPASVAVKCPECGQVAPIPPADEPVQERDPNQFLQEKLPAATPAETFTCPGCGVQIVPEMDPIAGVCPFCGQRAEGPAGSPAATIQADSVLPFSVSREEADAVFRDWIGNLWFAPGKLKAWVHQHGPVLRGVYVPAWTFEVESITDYTGERGEDYWTTETDSVYRNGKRTTTTRSVRHTRWEDASGRVKYDFNDLLVMGVRSEFQTWLDALEPWDLENLEPMDPRYVAGFARQGCDVDIDEAFETAQELMDPRIRDAVERDIGGDRQSIDSTNTQYGKIRFRHLLLPVWISTWRYRDDPYTFIVNGRTGELHGDRPWSVWKILATVLGLLGAIIALAAIVGGQ